MATTAKMSAGSEAQRIVDELVDQLGMQGAAIAREIGVKADTIQNIRRRHSTGNLQVQRLRILRDQLMSAAGQRQTPPTEDIPTQPVIEQLPSVDDLLSAVKDGPEPASVSLNGEEPTPAPAKTLKDKASDLLGNILGTSESGASGAAPRRKANKAESVEQGDLIEQLVPLAALLLVMSGSVLLPDPYKPVGPNHAEASAIVYPIVKRAVRELDARKKLSESTTDAIAILLAVGAYGVRAHGTYQQIHAMEVERDRSHHRATATGADAFAGLAAVPSAADPARSAGPGQSAPIRAAGPDAGNRRTAGRQTDSGAGGGDERRANAMLDELLSRDADGRKRLGIG